MTDSTFNRRAGRYIYDPPTGTHTWVSRVTEWSQRARVNIIWQRSNQGPAHLLNIVEVPVIDGVPHPEYWGSGKTSQEAKNMASHKIAYSGHC